MNAETLKNLSCAKEKYTIMKIKCCNYVRGQTLTKTYCGEQFIIYTSTESLYCRRESSMLYVNFASIKKYISLFSFIIYWGKTNRLTQIPPNSGLNE